MASHKYDTAAHARARKRLVVTPIRRYGYVLCVTCGKKLTSPGRADALGIAERVESTGSAFSMLGVLESARLVEDTVSKTAGAIALGGSIPSLSATPPPKPLSTKLKWEGPQAIPG